MGIDELVEALELAVGELGRRQKRIEYFHGRPFLARLSRVEEREAETLQDWALALEDRTGRSPEELAKRVKALVGQIRGHDWERGSMLALYFQAGIPGADQDGNFPPPSAVSKIFSE